MKNNVIIGVLAALALLGGLFMLLSTKEPMVPESETQVTLDEETANMDSVVEPVVIDPISHASFVFTLADTLIFNDPVGDAALYADKGTPDIILMSDVHGDHLSTSTLTALVGEGTKIIAPQAVYDLLPLLLQARTTVMANGDVITEEGVQFEAIPMYNLPETEDSRHAKGRGNGYVLEAGETRMYIAGDTADIPEMRALRDIDIAFVPMNLPYTMTVEAAADAVLEFKPSQVYPYHYRGMDGLSDVEKFKALVNAGDPTIEVVLAAWYPQP